MVVKGPQSKFSKVRSGVPQGTVLGHILYILFINDITLNVSLSQINFFAGDTRISKQLKYIKDYYQLQSDLDFVINWSNKNHVKLHEENFELIPHRANSNSISNILPFMNDYSAYVINGCLNLSSSSSSFASK